MGCLRTGEGFQFLDAEEGTFEKGDCAMKRRWNADRVDYGINQAPPPLLRTRLETYR